MAESFKRGFEFRRGRKKQQLTEYIKGADEIRSYAIENIIVRSAQLQNQNMLKIVIYDVPGFNSPFASHREQTKKMLYEADMIILVTDVAHNANLTIEHLNMLIDILNESDYYGTRIGDKVFVFGNRLDQATNPQNNINTLRNDAINRYNIVKDSSHVLFGAAGLFFDNSKATLNQFDAIASRTDIGTLENFGITKLLAKLREYYNQNRFTAIKEYFENEFEKIKALLILILNDLKEKIKKPNDGGGYYLSAYDEFKKNFPSVLSEIETICNQKMKNKPFTSLIETTDKIFPEQNLESNILKSIKEKASASVIRVLPLTEMDVLFRKKLAVIFLRNFVNVTLDAVQKKKLKFINHCTKNF